MYRQGMNRTRLDDYILATICGQKLLISQTARAIMTLA